MHTRNFQLGSHLRVRASIPLLLLVSLVGGCRRDPSAAPIMRRHVDYSTRANTVYLLDDWARRHLVVESHGADRSPTDALQVRLTVRNRTDAQLRVAARARFLGADAVNLETTEWNEGFVDKRALADFSMLSKSPDATGYVVEVRIVR